MLREAEARRKAEERERKVIERQFKAVERECKAAEKKREAQLSVGVSMVNQLPLDRIHTAAEI